MKRREFISLVGGAAAWPLTARAQQPDRMRRIGVLMGYAESDREGQANVAVFREALEKLGWAEGRNMRIDTRWATPGDVESRQRFVKELIALRPDVILSHGTPVTAALLQQTRTIPIVFAGVSDPVGSGFVASFPRPGGNVTGFNNMEPTMASKWLELLKEIAPRVNRVALLFNPATAPYVEYWLSPFKTAAASFTLEPIAAPVHDASELETVIAAQAREPNGGLIVMRIPSRPAIVRRLQHWRRATASRPCILSVSSLKSAACCRTEITFPMISDAPQAMPIAYSRAKSRASFPSNFRSSSSL